MARQTEEAMTEEQVVRRLKRSVAQEVLAKLSRSELFDDSPKELRVGAS